MKVDAPFRPERDDLMDRSQAVKQLEDQGIGSGEAEALVDAVTARGVDLEWFVAGAGQIATMADYPVDQIADQRKEDYDQYLRQVAGGTAPPANADVAKAAASKGQTDSTSAAADQIKAQAGSGDLQGAANSALALAQSLGSSGTVPSQVLQITGGRALTPDQLRVAIQAYNQANPGDQLKENDADGLYQRIAFNAPGAVDALGHAIEGQGLTYTSFSVWNPGTQAMKTVQVQNDFIGGALSAHAGAIDYLPQVIAAASRTGDEVPWQVLASAARLTGGMTPQVQKDVLARNRQENAFGQQDPGQKPVSADAGDRLAQQMVAAKRQFGDDGLALVSLKDPALASAIYERGHVAPDEEQRVNQILLEAGYDPQSLAQQGLAVDPLKYDALTNKSGTAGGSKPKLPDPKQLQEAARTLYEAWFVREPTDTELQNFVGAIDQKVVSSVSPGNPFKGIAATDNSSTVDPQSQLQDSLRSAPEYAQLFGQKPIGVSELDYANQFRSAGAGLLGGQIPNSDSVRIGMQTGNAEDTIRSQFGDVKSQNNSSFMQRLAQSANAVAQVT